MQKKYKNNSYFTIDFETATPQRNSACQVAMNVTIDGEIVETFESFIKPPGNKFSSFNMQLTGITPKTTKDKPSFKDIYYDGIEPLLNKYDGLNLMVAHNTAFDKSVFVQSSITAGITPNEFNWFCTHQAFKKLGYEKTKLNILCEKFNIPLNHHDARSDTMATAKLYLEYLNLVTL